MQGETRPNHQILGGKVMDGLAAKSDERLVDATAQDVEYVDDAGLATRGESPQIGAADEHRPGAEGKGLDDVATPADTAVEQHFDLVPDGLDDPGQGADRRRCPVEVVAAVVGDRDRVGADLDGAPRVFGTHDALDEKGTDPLPAQPSDVIP